MFNLISLSYYQTKVIKKKKKGFSKLLFQRDCKRNFK